MKKGEMILATNNKGLPYCSKCHRDDVELSNLSTKQQKNGTRKRYHYCRDCNTNRVKEYRKTTRGKERIYRAVYKSIKKHSHKQNARALLNYHLLQGNVTKPDRCAQCNEEKRLHGHHEDYSKPLEVVWVCRQCHADLHKK